MLPGGELRIEGCSRPREVEDHPRAAEKAAAFQSSALGLESSVSGKGTRICAFNQNMSASP